jgi:hypothetical protein
MSNKKLTNKYKSKKNKSHRNAGSKERFLNKKVAIKQLSQVGLSHDETNKILKEFASITIQGAYNKKNIKKIKLKLDLIDDFYLKINRINFKYFIESVNTKYKFNNKNIPKDLLDIKQKAERVIRQINMLLDIKYHPEKLKYMVERTGYNKLVKAIVACINNIRSVDADIEKFKKISSRDYKHSAQFGVELRPSLRNTTTKRTHAITRPPRSQSRSTRSTRKTKSI